MTIYKKPGPKVKTIAKFIIEAIAVHGNKYSYNLTDYKGCEKKVTVICNKCRNEFQQTPAHHLNGVGCQNCYGKQLKTTEQFIIEAIAVHGNKYSYNLIDYKHSKTKITIICNKCDNEFQQTPNSHLHGAGCPNCHGTAKKTTEQFIADAVAVHGLKYDYNKTIYINIRTKIIITCNKCTNEFQQAPNNHLHGAGCPFCKSKVSKGETKWLDILGIPKENRNIQFKLKNGPRFNIDGYDIETNTIYEYNGDWVHGNPDLYPSTEVNPLNKKTYGELYAKTILKKQQLTAAGYLVVDIWESEFNLLLKHHDEKSPIWQDLFK